MSKPALAFSILLIFLGSIFGAAYIHILSERPIIGLNGWSSFFGYAVGAFFLSGLIPVIVFARHRFALAKAHTFVGLWVVLLVTSAVLSANGLKTDLGGAGYSSSRAQPANVKPQQPALDASGLTPLTNQKPDQIHSDKASPDAYSFIAVSLPHGIKIDVPRSWRVLDDETNRLIATARDAALDLSGQGRYTGNVLIAANSTPATTYASLRVTVDFSERNSREDIAFLKRITAAELKELEPEFEAMMRKQFASGDIIKFLSNLGLASELFGNHPALVYRYRRSGPNGPVIVNLIQVLRPEGTIRINLAYRESEENIWKLVIARIKGSIRIV